MVAVHWNMHLKVLLSNLGFSSQQVAAFLNECNFPSQPASIEDIIKSIDFSYVPLLCERQNYFPGINENGQQNVAHDDVIVIPANSFISGSTPETYFGSHKDSIAKVQKALIMLHRLHAKKRF